MPRPEAPPKTPFGARLRDIRKGYGTLHKRQSKYTAKDFAGELGIEDETYRSYERGETQPPIETLAKIKHVTKASLDWLICGDQVEESRQQTKDIQRPRSHLRRA